MDIQERLTAFAMLGAEWVMWLLVVLSVVVVAICLERAYYYIASRDDIEGLKKNLLKRLGAGEGDAARKALGSSKSFEARIALAGVNRGSMRSASAEERTPTEQ